MFMSIKKGLFKTKQRMQIGGVLTVVSICFSSLAQDGDIKPRVMREAQLLVHAIYSGDVESAIQRMPLEVVEAMGGADGIRKSIEQTKAVSGKDAPLPEILKVTSTASVHQFQYAIVGTRTKMRSGGDLAIVDSYLVGISKDQGVSWVFLNGSDSVKARLIRKHPELAATLVFPVRVMRSGESTFTEVNGKWVPDDKTYQMMKSVVDKASLKIK